MPSRQKFWASVKGLVFRLRFLAFCFFKVRVTAAIDISGSTSPAWFAKIDSLLYQAGDRIMITVILFDTESYYCGPYNRKVGLEQYRRAGGGTDIEPAIEMANELQSDGLLIFTDGYFPPPAQKPKVKTLWVISPNGLALDNSYPGKAIYS